MKDQYFGDINDYRKYGLLRCIQEATDVNILVSWMLTHDDGSTDGKFIKYLEDPSKWEVFDPILYSGLAKFLKKNTWRQVSLIENSDILRGVEYYSSHVPDFASDRCAWFNSLVNTSDHSDFIFLDPDNGLEIKSKPYGRKDSSKYLYWHEVSELWSKGKSLLIYQHFIREKRSVFIQRMLAQLKTNTENAIVDAFCTPQVVFLLALQPKHHQHHQHHQLIVNKVRARWPGQIYSWEALSSS